jgi:hypothetical protein
MATYVTIVNTQAKDDIALLSELEALRTSGAVGPEQLVDRARPADSPVHHLFEWDDATASERYRLEQARLYIARVEYVPAPQREPYLVEMPTSLSRPERLDAKCLSGVDLTLCSMERMQSELEDIRKRYAACPDLAPVVEGPLDAAVRQISRLAMELPIEYPEDEELPRREAK